MKPRFAGVRPIFDPIAKEVAMHKGEQVVAKGITTLPAFGHTPGHTGFVIARAADSRTPEA